MNRLVVLSGMSQMYAINDPQEGDQTISEWLDDALSAQGARVWGMAAPNLSNEEALFQLVMLLQDPVTRPHSFIYGICFDKFRNIDLRPATRHSSGRSRRRWQPGTCWRTGTEDATLSCPEKMFRTPTKVTNPPLRSQQEGLDSLLLLRRFVTSVSVRNIFSDN